MDVWLVNRTSEIPASPTCPETLKTGPQKNWAGPLFFGMWQMCVLIGPRSRRYRGEVSEGGTAVSRTCVPPLFQTTGEKAIRQRCCAPSISSGQAERQ